MLRFLLLFITLFAVSGAAAACDMSSGTRAASVADYVEDARDCLAAPPQGFRFDPQMELAFIRKVNDERTRRGLKPLITRPALQPASRFHSLDMGINRFFGHETPAGRTHVARMAAFDRTLISVSSAENVAQLKMSCVDGYGAAMDCAAMPKRGNGDAMVGAVDELHRQLMESPGHRKNILSETSTHISLGVARTDHAVFVTQVFTQPVGELDQPLPLRLRAGEAVPVRAMVRDWTVRRFALLRDRASEDLLDGRIPQSASGDLELAVRGEKIERRANATGRLVEAMSYIYLSGPSFSALPATGS